MSRESFATNPERNLRWKGFLRKMRVNEDISFQEVMNVIRQNLQMYWTPDLL